MFILFLQSMIIGIAIMAPVGPVGIICIKTTISNGILSGLTVGLGSAVAAAAYAIAAGIGLAALTKFLANINLILRFGGGFFLLYLGITFFLKRTHYSRDQKNTKGSFVKTFITGFLLTLTSPMTILSFLGVMTAFEIEAKNQLEIALLVLGVLVGSILWWIFLASVVSFTAKRLNETVLNYINRISGIIIIAFGVYILIWM